MPALLVGSREYEVDQNGYLQNFAIWLRVWRNRLQRNHSGRCNALKMTRCPQVVAETLEKVKEILAENEYDLSQIRTAEQG